MKIKFLIPLFLILFLPLLGRVSQPTAEASPTANSLTNYELIRNGGFSHQLAGWAARGGAATNAQIEATADPQGGPAVKIFTNGQDPATMPAIYQEIHLPSTVTAAQLNFNVRVAQAFEGEPPQPGELVNGWIAIVPVVGDTPPDLNNAIVTGQMFGENQAAVTGWLQFSAPLDASAITALNNARTSNQRLVLLLATQSNSWRFSLLVDNVSMTVDGTQTVPNFTGEIAYIHNGNQIRRVSPTSGGSQTIWTHPIADPEINSVRWNPTATELAFSSDHESFFSPLSEDIYGIRPNGTQLRRITNAPAQSEIASGSYAKGSVLLTIFNNTDANISPFVVSVRGAAELKSVALPPYQQSTQLLVENVAQLGGEQAIIFIYSGGVCGANRRDTAGFATIVPGQTVNVNLTFNATNCAGFVPYAGDITWKRDGSEIGYALINGAYKVAATGSATAGSSWFASGLLNHVAWSPTNDLVLYDPATDGIHIRDVSTAVPGTKIITPGFVASADRPAWLPSGTGFLFIEGNNLFSADTQGNNKQQLTFFANGESVEQVSVAPDGNYVVFQRKLGDSSTLWLMERGNPANMWPLVAGAKPDWSRVTPSTPVLPPPSHFIYLPLVVR
ncbi:MAG: hypothetical protein OT477_09575 [Chloroflexi bacterium]|nr:hypothetical protein [Chloroflexota bacterium]